VASLRREKWRDALFQQGRQANKLALTGGVSMAVIAEPVAAKPVSRFRFILDRREVLGAILVAPAILYVLLLVGAPFLLAVYYSVSAYTIYDPSWHFVGLSNFKQIVQNPVFIDTLENTFLFTFASQLLGLVLGKFGAFLLLRPFPGRKIVRALVILPWAVPIALASVAWEWMFDSLYSVINWTLIALGIIDRSQAPNWLGNPHLAMLCVIVVNAWRFFPFAIVVFLAGITSVPQDIIDAATVDGAGFWRRNYQIIMPMILPIVAIGLIFGIVFTFTDLSVVYLLTNGGPVNATTVLGFQGFQVGIVSGDVSHGAAISLFMLPVLFVLVIGMLRFIRRREI
jgi:multiple sugar transport system permease protein